MNLSSLFQAADMAKSYEAAEDRISLISNPSTQVPPIDILSQATDGSTTKTRIDAESVRVALVSHAVIDAENLKAGLIGLGVEPVYDQAAPQAV